MNTRLIMVDTTHKSTDRGLDPPLCYLPVWTHSVVLLNKQPLINEDDQALHARINLVLVVVNACGLVDVASQLLK